MRALSAILTTSAMVLASAGTANAAGFYLTDIGTRGMGRGGAFVASPDSVLAIHYNPAGLAQLEGLNVEASVTFVNMSLDFNRKCPCVVDRSADFGGQTADAVDAALEASFDDNAISSNTTLVIPFVGASYGLPFYGLTFGLAAWGPNSGRHNWGELPDTSLPRFDRDVETQPGRYSGMNMNNLEANFALAAAAEPLDGLRIGFSLMGFQSGNNQTLHLWANTGVAMNPEDPRFDAPIVFEFKEDFAINWAVGASYDIIPGLTIGSSFRGTRNIDTEGTITVQTPRAVVEDPTALVVEGDSVNVRLKTAPIWRTGVQFRIPQLFAAEAAFVWEGWNVHDEVVIDPRDIKLTITGNESDLPQIRAARNWQNTWSLRLGGELNLFDPLVNVVGGYFYEPTGIAPANVDPSRTDFDKHGFSLGARTTWLGFTLDVSAMYVVLQTTPIRDNQKVLTIVPLEGAEQFTTNIGNGDYTGSYFLLSTSLSFALDPLLGVL